MERLGDQILCMCEESVKLFGPSIRPAFCRVTGYLLNLKRRISNNMAEAVVAMLLGVLGFELVVVVQVQGLFGSNFPDPGQRNNQQPGASVQR